jgi:GNAT superfamily N-acetyltransferase
MIVAAAKGGEEKEIVELLKLSLGESLLPKSEAFWQWKHQQNPFGTSKVLLAREGGQLIGLRAFMQWQWHNEQTCLRAVRAVDTATHPSFQGKGIFRKLTMQAVEECKAEGIHLVFNSPNPKSMAGYLTMGWKTVGRMPLCIAAGSLLPRKTDMIFEKQLYQRYNCIAAVSELNNDWHESLQGTVFRSPLNKAFVKWRYADCPVVQYGAIISAGEFGLIFRLKPLNRFYELRICEAWLEDNAATAKAAKAFRRLRKEIRPVAISMSPGTNVLLKRAMGFWLTLKQGPLTTVRPLALEDLSSFEHFNNWAPSIGAMELF